jgi:opacity protein-like surface antigen
MQRASVLILLLAAAAGVPQAHAQLVYSGPYIGLGVGVASLEDDGQQTTIGFSDTSSAYRLLAGYHIHEGLAIELGLAKSDGLGETLFGGNVTLNIEAELDVATLRVLAFAPLGGMDMFGGIGYDDADLTQSLHFTTPLGEFTDKFESNPAGLTFIGGVQFNLSKLLIRAEYEWFDDDKGVTPQSLNLGVVFRFGR